MVFISHAAQLTMVVVVVVDRAHVEDIREVVAIDVGGNRCLCVKI